MALINVIIANRMLQLPVAHVICCRGGSRLGSIEGLASSTSFRQHFLPLFYAVDLFFPPDLHALTLETTCRASNLASSG